MTLSTVGFDGEVSAVEFAQLMQHQGIAVPVVGGRDDFAVAANNAATLTCTVAPGTAYTPGVKATSTATESLVFDAVVTTGHTRWDAVVLRYAWGSGGSVALTIVKGTSAASAPAVLPGGVDLILNSGVDQVLALVQFTYGSTIPTAVLDRRAQAHPIYTFPSVTALPAASVDLYGMEAVAGGERYRCGSGPGGSPAWINSTPHLSRYRSSVYTLSNATSYTVDFNVSDAGDGITYAAGVATVPRAGRYQINTSMHLLTTATAGGTTLAIIRNGVTWARMSDSNDGENYSLNLSRVIQCSAGDTLSVTIVQTSGAAMTLFGDGNRNTYLDITYMGA